MKNRKRRKSPFSIPQDCVMQDYRNTPALKHKGAEGALHMFFSPHRVPVGLTDEEVNICISLYPLRTAKLIRTPEEMRMGRPMTRSRFKKGIYKLLAQISK